MSSAQATPLAVEPRDKARQEQLLGAFGVEGGAPAEVDSRSEGKNLPKTLNRYG